MSSPAADNDDTLRDDSTPDATTVDTTTDTAAAELDRFKENIRPLRQGRNVAALLSAMSLSTTAEEELFHERKRQFATRLKRYTGADPLALWHEHIIWLEQTAFRGANEGGLVDILRKCVQALHPDKLSARRPAYLADRRYVDVWLRLAGYSDEPLHVFEYMLQKQVGVHEPSLYTAWAAQLDAIRQSTRGLAVLERGKASVSTADDKALLEAAHQELESCIARRAVESVMAATEGNGESDILRLDDNDHFDVADRIGLRDFGGRLTAAPVSNKNQSNTNSSEAGAPTIADFAVAADRHFVEPASYPFIGSDKLPHPNLPLRKENERPKERFHGQTLPSVFESRFAAEPTIAGAPLPAPFAVHTEDEVDSTSAVHQRSSSSSSNKSLRHTPGLRVLAKPKKAVDIVEQLREMETTCATSKASGDVFPKFSRSLYSDPETMSNELLSPEELYYQWRQRKGPTAANTAAQLGADDADDLDSLRKLF